MPKNRDIWPVLNIDESALKWSFAAESLFKCPGRLRYFFHCLETRKQAQFYLKTTEVKDEAPKYKAAKVSE